MDFVYDVGTGRIASVTTPTGEGLSFDWDGILLTETRWSGDVTGSVGRTYNNDLKIVTLTVNATQEINFGFDNDSLLTEAGDLSLTRDPQNGLVTGTNLSGGAVTTAVTRDGFGAPTMLTASVGNTPVYTATYAYDAGGRIVGKTEAVTTTPATTFTYSYDAAGRLSAVQRDGSPYSSYGYDANDNRTSYTGPSGSAIGDKPSSVGRCIKSWGDSMTFGSAVIGYSAARAVSLRGRTCGGRT